MHERCRIEIPNGMNPTKKDQQLKDRPRFFVGGGGCATSYVARGLDSLLVVDGRLCWKGLDKQDGPHPNPINPFAHGLGPEHKIGQVQFIDQGRALSPMDKNRAETHSISEPKV